MPMSFLREIEVDERNKTVWALLQTINNPSAAKLLGISERTLAQRCKNWGIDRPSHEDRFVFVWNSCDTLDEMVERTGKSRKSLSSSASKYRARGRKLKKHASGRKKK